jgi:preprotein translocase subunit YajC
MPAQGEMMTLHDVAAPLAAQQSNAAVMQFLFLGLIVVAFYFFLIRPQRNRQRQQLQMQSSLIPGARVMTTNGMYATVVSIDDDGLTLEIAPGVEARFVKQAIMQIVDSGADDAAEDDETEVAAQADDAVEAETVDDVHKTEEKSSSKPSV